MGDGERVFVLVSPEVELLLANRGVDLKEMLRESARGIKIEAAIDPSQPVDGKKELLTVLIGSAAVIAALTPTLRELIRAVSRRDVIISERRLLPVQDAKGEVVLDTGAPFCIGRTSAAQSIRIPRSRSPSRAWD
jgi:hypothetical protein